MTDYEIVLMLIILVLAAIALGAGVQFIARHFD
jgi:hypothetical protein